MPRVVVYIQPGSVGAYRQLRICAEYCAAHGCEIVAVCRSHDPASAVTLATTGAVVGILVAFATRARPGDIRELAVAAGVEIRYVRPPVMSRVEALDVAGIYRRSGGDVQLVARLLGETTQEIRRILARVGIRRNMPPPAPGYRGRHNQR
jgi:hypothetical protein